MSDEHALAMFGELEDGPDDTMIVRIMGHRLGISDGWFHWGGLAVVFPAFQAEVDVLKREMPKAIDPENIHLAVDCYSGEVLILIKSKLPEDTPTAHKRLTLADILKEV